MQRVGVWVGVLAFFVGMPLAVLRGGNEEHQSAVAVCIFKILLFTVQIRRSPAHTPRPVPSKSCTTILPRSSPSSWRTKLHSSSPSSSVLGRFASDGPALRPNSGASRHCRPSHLCPASRRCATRDRRATREVLPQLEATPRGFDARYIVTSLAGEARHLYEGIYCARGQAENLIKRHKVQLASDRTSCQSPTANQFRLVPHTAAYWLMLALRDAVPRRMPLHWAEFATLRQSLLKIGARVVEKAARVRIHFASACPNAALIRLLAGRLAASGP